MEEVKTKSHLFHFLSGARAAPGVGQVGNGKIPIPFRIFSGFSAENDYGTDLNFYGIFF